ncbi:deoxyhypusine synthase [Candidatus Geothermarchaeota archaeon]|nr:MAG: deoxyhypusine synthase [Candidatus Geothermarchaeota archaeon]HEW94285.1 deoxyhypusine synthase [Thermoprotei archaeon]
MSINKRVVNDFDLESIKDFRDLLAQYEDSGGFMAKKLGEAYKIVRDMYVNRDEYTIFLSFPADVVATGLRGVLRSMVKNKMVDIIVTTCGSLDHDLARSFKDYYHGEFYVDDRYLKEHNIHRLGNVFIPIENYGIIIEEKMRVFLDTLYKEGFKSIGMYKLIEYLGKFIGKEDSLLYWAYRNKIPVIVPGPYDGAVGYQIWIFQQFHKDFKIDLFEDETLISNYVYDAKKAGAIIIGGGISKHHLLWWNQFRGGLDIAIQITTGVEFDGSLTGARLSEAVTWGKVSMTGREVSVWGEATVILPLLIKALLEEFYKM